MTRLEAAEALEQAVQDYVTAVQEADGDPAALVTGWSMCITGMAVTDGQHLVYVPTRQGQLLTSTIGQLRYAQQRWEKVIGT